MFRRLLYPEGTSFSTSVGLLLLRLVIGAAFIFHGWPKLMHATSWMPPQSGIDIPPVFQALAAAGEFFGGILLLLGLITRPAAIVLACIMIVALGKVHLPAGHRFVATAPDQHSYEIAAVYLVCMFLFLLTGPGRLSLDAIVLRRRPASTQPRAQA